MGFGLLVVGYFTATIMSLNTLGGVFSAVGFLMMLIAAKKLMEYDRNFLLLLVSSVIMLTLSAIVALGDVSAFLYKLMLIQSPLISETIAGAFVNIKLVCELFFTAILCYCVRSIAKQTGAENIAYAAVRNLVFYCISFALQIIVWLAANMQWEGLVSFVNGTALPIWMLIVTLFCLLINCVMLLSCYSKICDANDIDMPQKPSRFAFINRRREEQEKKRRQYIEEAEQYVQQQKPKKKK